jgi:hypothetical protein
MVTDYRLIAGGSEVVVELRLANITSHDNPYID